MGLRISSLAGHAKVLYHRTKVATQKSPRLLAQRGGALALSIVVDSLATPCPDTFIEGCGIYAKATANKQAASRSPACGRKVFTAEVKATTAAGMKIEKRQRMKPGMSNARIQLPPKTREYVAQPAIPLDLIGKPAADLQIATWINSEPLSAQAGGKVRILDFFGMQCAPALAS